MRASVNNNRGCEQESCHMTNWVRRGRLKIVCGSIRGWESLRGFDWSFFSEGIKGPTEPYDKVTSSLSN